MKTKRLFTLPKFFDASETYVYYSYRNTEGKMQRMRVYDGFKQLKGARKLAHAQKLIAEWTAKLKSGYDPFEAKEKEQIKDTFSIEYFLDEAMARKRWRRKNSKIAYTGAVKLFKEWLGENKKLNEPATRFTEDDANDYLDWLENEKLYSPTTRNSHRGFMGTIFNAIKTLLRKREIILDNKFLLTKKITEDRNGRKPFTPEQLKKIEEYLLPRDPELWIACQFVRYTFVRTTQELPRLKLSDINTQRMKLTVRGEISKNRRTQTVDLHPDILQLMTERQYFEHPPHYYIFSLQQKPDAKPYSPNTLTKRFSKVRDALKFSRDYSMYSFKHTGNAELHNMRTALPMIRDQNRHSDIRTTDIYSKQYGFYNEENVWSAK